MTHIVPVIDITGHTDGVALWSGDTILEVFPSFWDAAAGRKAAEEAILQLGVTLRRSAGRGEV